MTGNQAALFRNKIPLGLQNLLHFFLRKAQIHYFSLYSFLTHQHTIPIVSLSVISWFYSVWAITESHIKSSYVTNENFNEYVLGKWKTDGLPAWVSFISLSSQNRFHMSSPFYSYHNMPSSVHKWFFSFHLSVFTNLNSLNVLSIKIFLYYFSPLMAIIHFLVGSSHIYFPDFSIKSHINYIFLYSEQTIPYSNSHLHWHLTMGHLPYRGTE